MGSRSGAAVAVRSRTIGDQPTRRASSRYCSDEISVGGRPSRLTKIPSSTLVPKLRPSTTGVELTSRRRPQHRDVSLGRGVGDDRPAVQAVGKMPADEQVIPGNDIGPAVVLLEPRPDLVLLGPRRI